MLASHALIRGIPSAPERGERVTLSRGELRAAGEALPAQRLSVSESSLPADDEPRFPGWDGEGSRPAGKTAGFKGCGSSHSPQLGPRYKCTSFNLKSQHLGRAQRFQET